MKKLSVVFLFILSGSLLFAESFLNLLTWNIESGGNSPQVIAEQLEEYRNFDIITLIEVNDANQGVYEDIFNDSYTSVISESGARYNDHIMVIFNKDRLDLLESFELHKYQGVVITPNVKRGGKRSPLILRFIDSQSGIEFYYISVHFSRTNEAERKLQALILREWICDHDKPVLAAGDFNFDYTFTKDSPGNDAFGLFLYDDRIMWVMPEILADTNYSERNGKETYPDSILDFIFAANAARNWDISSRIIVKQGDFPDTDDTSDHRPVCGEIKFK